MFIYAWSIGVHWILVLKTAVLSLRHNFLKRLLNYLDYWFIDKLHVLDRFSEVCWFSLTNHINQVIHFKHTFSILWVALFSNMYLVFQVIAWHQEGWTTVYLDEIKGFWGKNCCLSQVLSDERLKNWYKLVLLDVKTLREKCPNTDFSWSVFSCTQSEYRKLRTRKYSVFGHFSRSENWC